MGSIRDRNQRRKTRPTSEQSQRDLRKEQDQIKGKVRLVIEIIKSISVPNRQSANVEVYVRISNTDSPRGRQLQSVIRPARLKINIVVVDNISAFFQPPRKAASESVLSRELFDLPMNGGEDQASKYIMQTGGKFLVKIWQIQMKRSKRGISLCN